MTAVVMDASAILAAINKELGAEKVMASLSESMMSTVNVSEVVTVLLDIGVPLAEARALVRTLVHSLVMFDEEQAVMAASLREKTKTKGLSLGDRACLSLGLLKGLPVMTADKAWSEIDVGAKVIQIR